MKKKVQSAAKGGTPKLVLPASMIKRNDEQVSTELKVEQLLLKRVVKVEKVSVIKKEEKQKIEEEETKQESDAAQRRKQILVKKNRSISGATKNLKIKNKVEVL